MVRCSTLHVEVLRLAVQWRRLVEVEPCDEEAHQELMRIALRAGNRHAAIRWYGRLRTNLERELGLAPGRRSHALYEECVAGLGPAGTAFVGRQVELARATIALRSSEPGALTNAAAGLGRGPGGDQGPPRKGGRSPGGTAFHGGGHGVSRRRPATGRSTLRRAGLRPGPSALRNVPGTPR